ncbi:MAG: lactate racemase domain-containing protein, partial [Pseudomonadota bacterium]|nr:lactate racemase domain-containing protein [Pseudomonadota bacterium]
MKVDLLYGKSVLTVSCPAKTNVTVIRKPSMPAVDNPGRAVTDAFAQAVGCDSLQSLAKGSRSACILICDITRPVPNHLFLRPLIEALIGAGISSENITVLVATGLHRPNKGDELASVIGDDWV